MQKNRFVKRLKKAPSGFLIVLVRIYQFSVSPMFSTCCRFTPTCSAYAITAIYKHGALKGLFFTSKRILRCNPFCKGGLDPVP